MSTVKAIIERKLAEYEALYGPLSDDRREAAREIIERDLQEEVAVTQAESPVPPSIACPKCGRSEWSQPFLACGRCGSDEFHSRLVTKAQLYSPTGPTPAEYEDVCTECGCTRDSATEVVQCDWCGHRKPAQ